MKKKVLSVIFILVLVFSMVSVAQAKNEKKPLDSVSFFAPDMTDAQFANE